MFRKLQRRLVPVLVLLLIFVGGCWFAPAVSHALSGISQAGTTAVKAPTSLPQVGANQGTIKTILSIVFGIIGSLAVLMIVISGVKYITSSGDPQKASEAKNGILFALIGLAIAILAQAIVAFVVNRI